MFGFNIFKFGSEPSEPKKEHVPSKWNDKTVKERAVELGSYSEVFDEIEKDGGFMATATWGGLAQILIGLGEDTNERLKELRRL